MIKIMESLKKLKKGTIEIIIITTIISLLYFLIILDGITIFIGPFNNIDNSITPARIVDIVVSLGIIFSVLFFLMPKYFENKNYKKFVLYSLLCILGFSMIEFFSDQIILYQYQLPANPEMALQKYNSEVEKFYNFTVLPGNLYVFIVGFIYALIKKGIVNEKKKSVLEREKLKAEITFLRSQINPHFLFNTLNNIYAITQRNNDEEAGMAITKLCSLLRFMLYEDNKNIITLEQEVALINNFIEINKLRFSKKDNIRINFMINGNVKGFEIEPLLLIPFVENAFKYGISAKPAGEIHISIIVNENMLNFHIENSIFKKPSAINSFSGIGLSNIKKRLSILYKEKHTLLIEEKNNKFSVNLKLKNRA